MAFSALSASANLTAKLLIQPGEPVKTQIAGCHPEIQYKQVYIPSKFPGDADRESL